MEWRDLQSASGFPIMHIMGSFDISIQDIGNGRVKFNVHNRTDLASGTHFLNRFPPDDQKTNPLSLERVIEEFPALGYQEAVDVLRNEEVEEEIEDDYSVDNEYDRDEVDYDRDTFDALTDGQYGDYDDWREGGGDFDSLRDSLGR